MASSAEEDPSDHYQVSVSVLRVKTKNLISLLLNPIKIIPTDEGLPRDWQGLAELVGVSGEYLPQLRNEADPTLKVLHWLENSDKNSVRTLINFLEKLDRYDVIDDATELIEEDIRLNLSKENLSSDETRPDLTSDKVILTFDDSKRFDQGLEPQKYDAFVLYANEDIEFATELIKTMEEQKNLKFCVKDRDLVGGAFEHEAIIKLISNRCNRLVVIISSAFFQSPANKFFLNFATAIGIDDCSRKIVPCTYTHCDIPLELKYYYILDFRRAGELFNFWDKLYNSIRTPSTTLAPKKTNLTRSISHQTTLQEKVRCTNSTGVTFNAEIEENCNKSLSRSANGSLSSSESTETKKNKSAMGKVKAFIRKNYSKCQKHKIAVPN